ncbi:MAG: hypothetical protein PHQ42_01425 [Patescibacteria group bacterium]|nr:hypothetical protein [Patescibacteria group bacterium]
MLNQNKEESKKLIPLRRLAKEAPYKVNYLSLLVQRGKLKAEKIGRNYFTTREWFEQYLEMHARDEKVERAEGAQAEKSPQPPLTKGGEIPPTPFNERGKNPPNPLCRKGVRKRREELDFSVLEKISEKAGEEDEFLKSWREKIGEEEGKKIEKKAGDNFFNRLFGLRNFPDSADKSEKLVFGFSRAKLAAMLLVLLMAAFSFSYFVPGAAASFTSMIDKTLIAPIEAARAVAESAGEAAKAASRLAAESSVFEKASQYSNKAKQEMKKVAGPVKEMAGRQIAVLADKIDVVREEIYERKIQPAFSGAYEAGRGRVAGISESAGTNLIMGKFLDSMKKAGRSVSDFYAKVVDFMTPDFLNKYAGQEEEKKLAETSGWPIIPLLPEEAVGTLAEEEKLSDDLSDLPQGDSGQAEKIEKKAVAPKTVVAPPVYITEEASVSEPPAPAIVQTQPQITILQASADGTTDVGGDLTVKGAAVFNESLTVDDNLTVKGVIYGGSPVKIAGGLKVGGDAEFSDSVSITSAISAGSLEASSAAISGNLTVGSMLSANFLNVSGTFSAQYAHFTSLSASSFLSGNSVSAGEGGLSSSGGLTVSKNSSGDIVNVVDGSADVFTIKDGGNIGIGTNSPSHKLDIDGNLGLSAGGYINWGSTDGTGGYGLRDNSGTLQFKNSGGAWGDIPSVIWSVSGADAYYTAGNVGIGTSTPYSKLSVWGFGTGTNRLFELTNSASTTLASFLENGTGYFLGNIGIGTTSPYAKLSVAGNIAVDGTITASTFTATSSISAPYFTATDASATSTFAGGLTVDTSGLVYDWQTGNVGIGTTTPAYLLDVDGDFRVGVESKANTFYVDTANERVGIGTASPIAKLTVKSAGYINTEGIRLEDASGNGIVNLYENTVGSGYISLRKYAVGNTIILNAAGNSWIDNGANFGIGTSSPQAVLEVNGDFRVGEGANFNGLFVDATQGKVGIGTDSPGAKLDIMTTSGNIQMRLGSSGSATTNFDIGRNANGYLEFTGNQIGYASYRFNANAANQGSFGAYDFRDQETSRLFISTAGNIGIGTTSPAYLLDVNGDMRVGIAGKANTFYVDTANERVGIGTDSPGALLDVNGIAKVTKLSINTSQNQNYLIVSGNASIGYNYRDVTAPQNGLIVEGNVGIGTTTPAYLLDVDGDFRVGVESKDNTFYVDTANERVGIGTASAGAKLGIVVSGTDAVHDNTDLLTTADTSDALYIQNENAAANSVGLILRNRVAGASTWGIFNEWQDTDYGDLVFRGRSGGATSKEVMRLEANSGNVGIGTTSPMSKLSVTSNSGSQLTLAYDDTNYANFTVGSDSQLTIAPANNATTTIGVGDEALRVDSSGNIGVGTTTPKSKLSILGGVDVNRGVIVPTGSIDISGSYLTNGADYAEYYYSIDNNLEPGEAVCVDIERENAVKRCERAADGNLMGIVSTKPAIVGNGGPGKNGMEKSKDNHYAIIGMLGQVPARVTTANGPIRPGDSLTSASRPGYVMRASAGDPTVGVALEGLDTNETNDTNITNEIGTGVINVLISRRNKSLTVEEIEEKVTERIANMEIEDEVNILIANAINNLNLDDEITEVLDPKLLLLETRLTVKSDDLGSRIVNMEKTVSDIISMVANLDAVIRAQGLGLREEMSVITDNQETIAKQISIINSQLNTNLTNLTNLTNAFAVDEYGNIKLGKTSPQPSPSQGEGGVAVVEIVTATTTAQTAFVINQSGSGDVADFRANDVSILNIGVSGKVSIVGTLAVDGRIMACSGSSCGTALDLAVDETMGDIGVEGKVVAGAFEGYCEEGFVWAPGSAKYGTMPGFCVAARIARLADTNETNLTNITNVNGQVWNNISQGEAGLACQSLGAGYHLISENEWLTMAENIINTKGTKFNEKNELSEADGVNEYVLSNDNVVYMNIGIGEWTNQTITKKGAPELNTNGTNLNEWYEYFDVIDFKGLNIAPPYYLNDADNNIGKIKIGSNIDVLRGFVRGAGGIYSLDLSNAPTAVSESIGFRCAR